MLFLFVSTALAAWTMPAALKKFALDTHASLPAPTRGEDETHAVPAGLLRRRKGDGDKHYMVTIGDSYSSGTGIHNFGSSYDVEEGGHTKFGPLTANDAGTCWREWDTTPGPKYARKAGLDRIFGACKGAEIPHINRQLDMVFDHLPESVANRFEGSTFMLTAGGNDIRAVGGYDWPEILKRCLTEAKPGFGCNTNSKNRPNNWHHIKLSLIKLYTKIYESAGKATVRVMGYPRMLQPERAGNTCKGTDLVGGIFGLSVSEARWIDQQVDILNEHIAGAVAAVRRNYRNFDIQYVDVRRYFHKGACSKHGSQVNGLIINTEINPSAVSTFNPYTPGGFGAILSIYKAIKTISDPPVKYALSEASFHPNQAGYDAYYRAFTASL